MDFRIPTDFDANTYLELNPDVKEDSADPVNHYMRHGIHENRIYQRLAGIPTNNDIQLHPNSNIRKPKYSGHENIWNWIKDIFDTPGLRVLEIGSRNVVSEALWKEHIPNCDYVGLDILPGANVDIVGDAHRLSDYFEPESFDLVISFAVFEHLYMPWIVAEEIFKVLAINGKVVIETHFSFSEHEWPWNFFQFNSKGLEILFSPEMGFETIDSGMDNPIIGRFSEFSAEYLKGKFVPELYCHSSIIANKTASNSWNVKDGFDWRNLIERSSSETQYPKKTS